jgi:hypothetical protein
VSLEKSAILILQALGTILVKNKKHWERLVVIFQQIC